MKKIYIIGFLTSMFLLTNQLGYAQNNLADNEFGFLIKNWLEKNKDNYNLSATDLSDLVISDAYFSTKTRINHVYLNQAYQGIKIHNAISSIAIKDDNVFYYNNRFISNISNKANATTPSITGAQAIKAFANDYGLNNLSNIELISSSSNNYVYNNAGVSQLEIPVELMFQKTVDGNLNLVWDLNVKTLDGKNWYSVRVDAISGQILDVNNWILTCNFGDGNHSTHTEHKEVNTVNLFKESPSMMVDGSNYTVFAIPTESPNHGSRITVTQPADQLASPFGWHDTNGSSGPEFTITRGNNVWAKDDTDGNNSGGSSPDGGSSLSFDYLLNLNQEPIGYLNASITNLFYVNNVMHDVWYQYGFDEASGNFQATNYTNTGAQGDFVNADAQDGSGLNNASFGTPPDGGNPKMTMFLWSASGSSAKLLTINNGTLAGDYSAKPANFGGSLPASPITQDIILVMDDNTGTPESTDANDACNTITNGSSLLGKIAILRRGVCEFSTKVLAAENNGAVAVIVVNNVATPGTISMGAGSLGDQVTIPSIMVNQTDGEAIINALSSGQNINGSLMSAGGSYQKDSSLDNGIIVHEYGHGISTRLAGGPASSNCLGNAEQMGEGWSDWFALMVTLTSADSGSAPKPMGTYSLGQSTDGAGIRPFPYSTDTTVNPLTYGDTNDTSNISKPHGIGTVWATILWDLNWKYIEKYGFDPDFYKGTGGNNKIMQIVLDGLKLQGCTAGFVDGRDGILAADMAITNGEDQCMIWEVFAARGVGVDASQGSSNQRTDQIESFKMPPTTDPSLQNCKNTTLSVDEFNLNSQYSIFPNPTNNVLNIKVKKNFGDVILTLTDLNGRIVLTKNANLSSDSQLNISTLQSGMYILNIKGENINTNDKILKN